MLVAAVVRPITQTLFALRTSCDVNAAPSASGHWRMSKYSADSPRMRVNQFWFPAATCVVETTSSLTADDARNFAPDRLGVFDLQRASAAATTANATRCDAAGENLRITFCPRLAICASTCAFAPLPMPTIAITAPTPMMMPSAVRTERSLFLPQRAERDLECWRRFS